MLKEKYTRYNRHYWDTECSKWTERSSYTENVWIKWLGFTSTVPTLIAGGWQFEIVRNRFTGRKKLYMRHKALKLVGRARFQNVENTTEDVSAVEGYEMEFITNEKNQFINPTKIKVESEQVIGMEYSDIPAVLHEISLLQKENMNKPTPKAADIIEFARRASQRMDGGERTHITNNQELMYESK